VSLEKNTKYSFQTIFDVFLSVFLNLQSAHKGQYVTNFQAVKAKPLLFFLTAWSLKCITINPNNRIDQSDLAVG